MTILSIRQVPDPILRLKAALVNLNEIDDAFWTFTRDMMETAEANGLVGLAANQVGVPKRIFVINVLATDDPEKQDEHDFKVFINPYVIPDKNSTKERGVEGCASVPNLVGRVRRHDIVDVDYWTSKNQHELINFSGYLARVAQHEADHLDGILMTDKAEAVWKKET